MGAFEDLIDTATARWPAILGDELTDSTVDNTEAIEAMQAKWQKLEEAT